MAETCTGQEPVADPFRTSHPGPNRGIDPYPGGPDLLIEDEEAAASHRARDILEDIPLSLVDRFGLRLANASGALGSNLRGVFARGLDEQAWEELEESLIAADVGGLRERVRSEGSRTVRVRWPC